MTRSTVYQGSYGVQNPGIQIGWDHIFRRYENLKSNDRVKDTSAPICASGRQNGICSPSF